MQGDLSFFGGKRVLVTGGAGFVGSHLCDGLLEAGADVYAVDNYLTGRPDNLQHLETNPHFTFIQADVINDPLAYLPKNVIFDVIFHFASPASPPRYQTHPVETYLVNSLATHQLLQYLLVHNPDGRFVFASTSEVYGDPQEHPQKETYWGNVNPNGPRSCYDESKRLGETICGVHSRDLGLDVRIVRIFNTYGPRINPGDGRVIPQFISEALANQPLTVYGDGSQTRSYCYVSDLVAGILLMGVVEAARGETINLGNPNEFTVLETANIVRELVGNRSEIVFKPLPTDDPTRRRPDITKATSILGWEPKVEFTKGLELTLTHFSANLQ